MYPVEVIIDHAVKNGECEVRMGYASQREVDKKRDELAIAATKLTTEPLEIVTLPLGRSFGEVGLLVRKFKAPPLGTCEGHRCMPKLPVGVPHIQYYDCQGWEKIKE
jgi:hypothetical protein